MQNEQATEPVEKANVPTWVLVICLVLTLMSIVTVGYVLKNIKDDQTTTRSEAGVWVIPGSEVETLSPWKKYPLGVRAEVRWYSVDGDLCLRVKSTTAQGLNVFDSACGFGEPVVPNPGRMRIVEGSGETSGSLRTRVILIQDKTCIETFSGSGYGVLTLDCLKKNA